MIIVEVINALMNRNGAQIFAVNLCKELVKNPNNKIYLLSLHNRTDKSILKDIVSSGIEYIELSKKGKLDFATGREFKKVIRSIKPDLIHFHLSCLPTYIMAFGFKKQPFKLLQTFHSVPSHEVNIFTRILMRKKLISFVGISNEITKFALNHYKNIQCNTIFNGIPLKEIEKEIQKIYDFVIVASMTPIKNLYS